MIVHTETDEQGITYTLEIEPEDIPVQGNVIASGDDALDKEVENELLKRLNAGDLWAWCWTKVTASFDGFKGIDTLGGCSYRDTPDFLQGGYYEDMKAESRRNLLDQLAKAGDALKKLKEQPR